MRYVMGILGFVDFVCAEAGSMKHSDRTHKADSPPNLHNSDFGVRFSRDGRLDGTPVRTAFLAALNEFELRICGSLFEYLKENIGSLGARDTVFAVDDEERDASNADFHSFCLVLAYLGAVGAVGEYRGGGFAIEANFNSEICERLAIVERKSFDEVRTEEAFFHDLTETFFLGEVEEAVGVEGVSALSLGEVEVEPFVVRGVGDLLHHGARSVDAHAVFASEGFVERQLGHRRGARVELEALPLHFDFAVELFEGGFEAALADVAPGTNDVGPNLNFHNGEPRGGLVVARGVGCAAVGRGFEECSGLTITLSLKVEEPGVSAIQLHQFFV